MVRIGADTWIDGLAIRIATCMLWSLFAWSQVLLVMTSTVITVLSVSSHET